MPVIYLKTDRFEGYFLVDTGASHNILPTSGDLSPFFSGNIKSFITAGLADFHDCPIEFYVDSEWNEDQIIESDKVIGVLGQPFLRSFSSVTFDYQKNKLILNDRPLRSKGISFIHDDEYPSLVFISYSIGNLSEIGLVDTGGAAYVIRKTYTDENFGPGVVPENYIILDDVQISDIQFSSVPAYFCDSPEIETNENAVEFLKQNSSLGYTFWKNHVIQLDFENQIFRIK